MKTASWIVRDVETKRPILEVFSDTKMFTFVKKNLTPNKEMVPVLQHLQEYA